MTDDLKEESYVKMKRRAEDRVAWRCWMPRPVCGQRTNDDDDDDDDRNFIQVTVVAVYFCDCCLKFHNFGFFLGSFQIVFLM